MDELTIKENYLFDWIKDIILKYCPITDDRLFLMDDARKTPELEIMIAFINNETRISFMFGSHSFKHSLIERANVNKYINDIQIINLIDFILSDHESISFINFDDINDFSMGFAINWHEKSLHGIECGDITLRINFNNNSELAKSYILTILNRYDKILEHTSSFQRMKAKYISSLKQSYFSSIDKDNLQDFISYLSENEDELRELLTHVNDDSFINYLNTYNYYQDDDKLKLIKEKN